MKYKIPSILSLVFAAVQYMFNRIIRLFWDPVCNEEDISEKTVIITGANAGLGKCTALKLAQRGANIVMGCRNMAEGEKVRQEIIRETGNTSIVIQQNICSKSVLF